MTWFACDAYETQPTGDLIVVCLTKQVFRLNLLVDPAYPYGFDAARNTDGFYAFYAGSCCLYRDARPLLGLASFVGSGAGWVWGRFSYIPELAEAGMK